MKKMLVTYISFSGVTKEVALKLQQELNCDIMEIKPKVPYTKEDLDWTNPSSRSTLEMQEEECRPEIDTIQDISSYDIIFIGYPIWWGTFPREINTFLDMVSLEGKTIVPFCTSGGSGIDPSILDFKKYLPNSRVLNGKRVTAQSISSFLESLDLEV